MNIAIPTIWFHRGQTVVSQTLARALREVGHEVFIHARMGAVYGHNKQEKSRWGWDDPGIIYWTEYDLKLFLPKLIKCLNEQKIDLVLFNEEYAWDLVREIKKAGFKVATYLDYLHRDWSRDLLQLYDRILCSTDRAYEMMPAENRHYIGWGIHEDSVIQRPFSQRPYLFFENAGWLGINDRKGLGTLLHCFQELVAKQPHLSGSLLVQCQVEIDREKNASLLRGVDVMTGSMNPPGLYHMAQVYCYPAILDGLGLSLLEAIASGCAVICPDALPWNEFVEHEQNGLLVPIADKRQREDGIAFPEVFVDIDAWIRAMELLAGDEGLRAQLCKAAISVARGRIGWDAFKSRIAAALGEAE